MSTEILKNESIKEDLVNSNSDTLNSSLETYLFKDTIPLIDSETNKLNKNINSQILTNDNKDLVMNIKSIEIPNENNQSTLKNSNITLNDIVNSSFLDKNNNINIDLNNNDNNSNDDSVNSNLSNLLMCRICHCEETSEEYLITPCYCSGTLRYVHQSCLQQWLKSNG